MKLYFAVKSEHTNINGYFYSGDILKDAVNELNTRYKNKSPNPYIVNSGKPATAFGLMLTDIIGSLGFLQFDDNKQMYFAEAKLTKDWSLNIQDLHRERLFILLDCVKHANFDDNNQITTLMLTNAFYLVHQKDTNIEGDFSE